VRGRRGCSRIGGGALGRRRAPGVPRIRAAPRLWGAAACCSWQQPCRPRALQKWLAARTRPPKRSTRGAHAQAARRPTARRSPPSAMPARPDLLSWSPHLSMSPNMMSRPCCASGVSRASAPSASVPIASRLAASWRASLLLGARIAGHQAELHREPAIPAWWRSCSCPLEGALPPQMCVGCRKGAAALLLPRVVVGVWCRQSDNKNTTLL
jgi:hypothetical protein